MQDRSLAAEWTNQTNLEGLGLLALIVCGVALLAAPRRYAVLPMALLACLVASAQRVVIGGLDFDLLRIMVIIGWVRILARHETRGFTFKPIDMLMIAWALSGTIAYTLLYGTTSALINRLGFMFDAAGMYFMFRVLIRDWSDIDRVVVSFIWVSIPVAIAFLIEHATGRNAFSIFGGVPATTVVRDGKLRCQGAFSHAILAGCFFAGLLPLFAARWWMGRRRRLGAIVGVTTSLIIIAMTNSSTPLMGVMLGVFGGLMFYLRRHLRAICWSIVGLLAILHFFVMKSPVWHLLAKINVVSGSTGWHRYKIIDCAVDNFREWWLLGVKDTAHWGFGMQDVTNQYILEGVRGGLLTMILFFAVLVLAFRGIRQRFALIQHDRRLVAFTWAIGVSLFVHCAAFIAVSYFGQIKLLWYLTLAIIGTITPLARASTHRTSPQPGRRRGAPSTLPSGPMPARQARAGSPPGGRVRAHPPRTRPARPV